MSTIKYQSRELLVCRIIEFLTPRQQSINLDKSKFKELVKRIMPEIRFLSTVLENCLFFERLFNSNEYKNEEKFGDCNFWNNWWIFFYRNKRDTFRRGEYFRNELPCQNEMIKSARNVRWFLPDGRRTF